MLLIIPPAQIQSPGLHPSLGYLAGALKAASHQVRVIDFVNDPERCEERLDAALASIRPDIAGVYVTSMTIRTAAGIVVRVRELSNPKLIVAGGPHPSIDPAGLLHDVPGLDAAVAGEGEAAIVELCDAAAGKKELGDIAGIAFRSSGDIVRTLQRAPVSDLDSLPLPDYSCFDTSGLIPSIGYPLVTSRGCTHCCSYCAVPVLGRYRARDVRKVAGELFWAMEKYQTSRFVVVDDAFSDDIARAKIFCDLLLESGKNTKWYAMNLRADKVDAELLGKMKASGCDTVTFGVESGDADVLRKTRKGETLEDIERGAALAKSAGLRVFGYFIVGLPHSSFASEMKSLAFAQRVGFDLVFFWNFLPLPGTAAAKWVENNGRMLMDYKDAVLLGHGVQPVFETDEFSRQQRIDAYCICNIKSGQCSQLLPKSLNKWQRRVKTFVLHWKYDRAALAALAALFVKRRFWLLASVCAKRAK